MALRKRPASANVGSVRKHPCSPREEELPCLLTPPSIAEALRRKEAELNACRAELEIATSWARRMAEAHPMTASSSTSSPPWLDEKRRRESTGVLSSHRPETALIALSDPGQDLDDEMAFIMMRLLVKRGLLDLRGIITTLAPASDRARLCFGTLNLLGLSRVPVGVGTDGGDLDGKHTMAPFEHGACSYMPTANSEAAMTLEPGRRLLARLYADAEPHSITLLIIASLKDAALFLRDNEQLFHEKTKEVVIMGGAQLPLPEDGSHLTPDTAHNQEFDTEASKFFFRRCQELGIRLIIVSRFVAYAAKVSRDTYDKLALSGSSIGRRLRNAQRVSIEQLWHRAASPCGDARRKGLPDRCNRRWFIDTFCNGVDDPGRTADQPVWDLVDGFNQYDSMALFAAVPKLRSLFYDPVTVQVKALDNTYVDHLVIGCNEATPNVSLPNTDLMKLLHNGFDEGLSLNHHFKAQVILLAQLRYDTVSDMAMTAVILRTLYQLETLHCIGIVILRGKPEHGPSSPETTPNIPQLLNMIGLRFVPISYADCDEAAVECLHNLYSDALPVGVTLVVTTSLTAVSSFVERDPTAFREKTARVVHLGGVQRSRDDPSTWLDPDADAQEVRLDVEAARRFYNLAQEISVPLVVLSRFAAQGGKLPRALFDVLASHGGEIGHILYETQRATFQELWQKVCEPISSPKRGDLPSRCDRQWFLNTFSCRNISADDSVTDVWQHATSFNVYSPLALLVALPGVMKSFMKATPVEVRAATHHVIGWSAEECGVEDPIPLQKVISHCLMYGARCNASEFSLGEVPPILLRSNPDVQVSFDMSEEALDRILPPRSALG